MRQTAIILTLIILIALAFRLGAVLTPGSFWFDEIISLKIAQHNIVDSWQYLKWENNPPLHYWMLHAWIKLFGASEVALRLSSVLFSLLAIIALYFLGKLLFNKKTGLVTAFLAAVSSFQLFLSSDARMYPMLLLFSSLAAYFLWRWLNQQSLFSWLGYIIFTGLALYTHLTAVYLIVACNLYFLYHYFYLKRLKPNWLKWLASQIVIGVAFLPWLITFTERSLSMLNSGAWYLHTSGGGFLWLEVPLAFLIIGDRIPLLNLAALLIFGFLFISAFTKFYQWSAQNKELRVKFNFTPATVFSLLLFLVPLSCGFIIHLWVAKYYLVGAIGFYLLLAAGYNNLQMPKSYKYSLLLLIALLVVPFNLNLIKNNKHSWDKTAAYVDSIARPEDKVLISAFIYQLAFEHYYHGSAPVMSYQPRGLEGDKLLRTVKYNWLPVLSKDNLPDMQQIIGNSQRVIVVHPAKVEVLHNANVVINWFIEHHWKLLSKKRFGGFVQPTVLIFSAPQSNNKQS